MKKNISIEIVSTQIKGLSSMSSRSRDGLIKTLSELYDDVRITFINNLEDLEELVVRKPSLVFLGMKYMPVHKPDEPTEKLWLAEYLDDHSIAYTGSTKPALMLELYKPSAKKAIRKAGLATSNYQVIKQSGNDAVLDSLLFPIFVKPTGGGGGQGVDSKSVTTNHAQLNAKIRSISKNHDSDSLLENYLSGREFSVAILKNVHTLGFLVMPIEIITPENLEGNRVLSSETKYENEEIVSVVSDMALNNLLKTLAINSFYALGARDYGRIDIRLDENGVPHFLEANLIPSLVEDYGNFPKACKLVQNIEFATVISSIAELGLARLKSVAVQQPSVH